MGIHNRGVHGLEAMGKSLAALNILPELRQVHRTSILNNTVEI